MSESLQDQLRQDADHIQRSGEIPIAHRIRTAAKELDRLTDAVRLNREELARQVFITLSGADWAADPDHSWERLAESSFAAADAFRDECRKQDGKAVQG